VAHGPTLVAPTGGPVAGGSPSGRAERLMGSVCTGV
jgi:hypothetical protein